VLTPAGQHAWIDRPGHRAWLAGESARLLDFYLRAADLRRGGFGWIGDRGEPEPGVSRDLWLNARLVHCFALGSLLGRPGCRALAEHGLAALRELFHDRRYGGWYWSAGPDGPADPRKQTYGHAFVLLAACTAAQAGCDAGDLLAEAAEIIQTRLLEAPARLYVEGWDRDWTRCEDYRGQNPNMHLVEAFMAAAEVTGEAGFTGSAVAIAERIIGEFAAGHRWRVPEHFDARWRPQPGFNRDRPRDVLRPYGYTPGHSMEWSRLLIQLRAQAGGGHDWMLQAARRLFERAVQDAWDRERTGFAYTVDGDGAVCVADRFHWVLAEAIGAAAYLYRATGDRGYDRWYQRFWDHAAIYLIDREYGGWRHELGPDNRPARATWHGKPDLYHALQATLFARTPPSAGLGAALAADGPAA
jgi:sulfoquinovose isomerase